jgi:hypothetical protein
MNNIRILALLIWIWVLEGIFPRPVLAIQPHGPPEGFYLHLIAHLVFIGALIFFINKLAQAVREHRSFRLLIWAFSLLILWNLDHIIAHLSALSIGPQDFIGHEGDLFQRLIMSGFSQWIYYLASLDHFIFITAGYLFYRGLIALAKEPETG